MCGGVCERREVWLRNSMREEMIRDEKRRDGVEKMVMYLMDGCLSHTLRAGGGRVRLGARAWEAEPRPKGFMGPPAGGSRRGRAPGGELLRA